MGKPASRSAPSTLLGFIGKDSCENLVRFAVCAYNNKVARLQTNAARQLPRAVYPHPVLGFDLQTE